VSVGHEGECGGGRRDDGGGRIHSAAYTPSTRSLCILILVHSLTHTCSRFHHAVHLRDLVRNVASESLAAESKGGAWELRKALLGVG
jgi:hypothetical protein